MLRGGRSIRCQFGRRNIQSHAIPAWREMDESLEMRVADRPLGTGEILLKMCNGQNPIECARRRISRLTVDQEDFLVNLERSRLVNDLFSAAVAGSWKALTHELSGMDRMFGAYGETGSFELEALPLAKAPLRDCYREGASEASRVKRQFSQRDRDRDRGGGSLPSCCIGCLQKSVAMVVLVERSRLVNRRWSCHW